MKKPAKRNPRAIIVLGMHRSGTSALMRLVNLRGVDLGSNLMPPVPNYNEKGFWEHMDIYRLNEKLLEDLNSSWDDVLSLPESWWESEAAQRYKLEIINILERDFSKSHFWGVKDPRICRFLPVWRPLLEQIGSKAYFLIIVRNPLEIVSSLAKRDGFSQGKSCLLWLKHIIESEKGTRNTPRLFVTYEELLSDWKGLMSRAQKSFQFKWPVTLKKASPEIASYLQKSLRHNIVNDTVLIEDNTLSRWIKDLYFETKGAINGDDSQLIKTVTAIEAELKDANSLYEPAVADIWARYRANHAMLQEQNQQLDDIRIRLEESNQDRGYHLSTIDNLQTAIKEKNERIQQLDADLTELRDEFRSSQEAAAAREAQFANLQSKVKEREERFQQLDTGVVELRDQLSTVQQTVVGRETEITHLQTAIKEKNEHIQQLDADLTDLRNKFASSQEAGSARETRFANLQSKVKEREERIRQLNAEVGGLRDQLSEVQQTAVRRETEVTHLQTGIKDRDVRIQQLDGELTDLRDELSLSQETASAREARLANLHSKVKERDERIQQLDTELSGLREETAASQEALSARETEVKNLHIGIVEKDDRIHELDANVRKLQNEVEVMRTQVKNYRLELDAISGSKSWKLSAPFRWVFMNVRKSKRKLKTIRYLFNRQYRLIEKSGLFDPAYYLDQNPDAAESGMDPLAHYLRYGAGEGRDPNPLFDTSYYLDQNPDVADSGTNPLAHYLRHDAGEGRDPNPLFDTSYYLEQNPDVAESGMNPLAHYLRHGASEGRDPNPLFDTSYYLKQNPDVAESGTNPLAHYLSHGGGEGRDPNPLFDTSYYLDLNPCVTESRMNPLEHYLKSDRQTVAYEDFALTIETRDEVYEQETIPNSFETDIKMIAFYLPQFHPIPENDEVWGKGFTEWTNVTKARPLYGGHYQPRLPDELGFYDLRLPEVMRRQADLARLYGIFGFCFHHYWFNGKRVLERPLDQFLANKDIDINFCLSWANENWTKRWDGLDNEIILKQEHTTKDDIEFIKDTIRFFSDTRYIKIDEKPLLIIYNPSKMPNPKVTAERWREYCTKAGFDGLFLVAAQSFGFNKPIENGFDGLVEFPPLIGGCKNISKYKNFFTEFKGNLNTYKELMEKYSGYSKSYTLFKTIVPAWDNTARRGKAATIFEGSSPNLYQQWLERAINITRKYNNSDHRFVFVNAWNEWAEGAYLEPDRKYGYAYLNATAKALYETGWETSSPSLIFIESDASDGERQNELLRFLTWIKKSTRLEFRICLIKGGYLLPKFKELGKTLVLEHYDHKESELENINHLLSDFFVDSIKLVFVNTFSPGNLWNTLQKFSFSFLIHLHKDNTVSDLCELQEVDGVKFFVTSKEKYNDLITAQKVCKSQVVYVEKADWNDETFFWHTFSVIRNVAAIKPAVSVIVPCFNHAQYLPKRLDSIFNQTFKDFEVILIDDASTDDTHNILAAHARWPNCKLENNLKNSGIPFAQWIKGIKKACADLLWIAEDDDYCSEDFLETLLPAFENPNVKLAYCATNIVDDKDNLKGNYNGYLGNISSNKWQKNYTILAADEVKQALGIKNTIPNASGVIFRKFDINSIVEELKTYKFAGDWFFYLHAIQWGYLHYCAKPMNYHRRHKDTVMAGVESTAYYFQELDRIQKFLLENFVLENKTLKKVLERIRNEWDIYLPGHEVNELKGFFMMDELEGIIETGSFFKTRRIAVVIGGFYFGGGEIFPIRLANHMASVGHKVYLFNVSDLPNDNRVAEMVSADVTVIEARPDEYKGKHFRNFIRENDIEIINSHGWNSDKFIVLNIKSLKIPWEVTMHGHYEALLSGSMKDDSFSEFLPEIIKHADHFIYLHPKNLDVFETYPLKNKDQAICIPIGMPSELPKSKNRSTINISEDAFVLGMVTRAIPEKGWEQAIQGVHILNKTNENKVHLVLIGDSDYAQALKTKYESKTIHFLGFSDEVLSWIQIFDVGLLPTYYVSESQPLCVMEYLACEKPVISTRIARIPDMIDGAGKKAGFLIDLGPDGRPDPNDIAKCVYRYIQEPDLLKQHRLLARKAFKKFDMDTCVKNYIKLFNKTLKF